MSESRFTKRTSRDLAGLGVGWLLLGVALFFFASPPMVTAERIVGANAPRAEIRASNAITYTYFLSLVAQPWPCLSTGEIYGSVTVLSPPANPPAEINPDINLAMRGYVTTTAFLGLVDYGGPSDYNAPQLYGLFTDKRTATFRTAYRVYDWDWVNNRRGNLISDYPVTLAGVVVTPTEIIRAPASGYDIGRRAAGYSMMVLYATENRITLKYSREDSIVSGYTLHLENICVDPSLLALYKTLSQAGRSRLPALFADQGIGRAITTELGVAIRDTGSFMDPRSREDWWRGR